jgi:hypothetical protein
MTWATRTARFSFIAVVPLVLTGCIEFSSRSEIHPDGSMTSYTDIALNKSVVDEITKMQAAPKGKSAQKQKAPAQDFVSLCKGGFGDLMKEEQAKTKPKAAAKGKSPTPPVELPKAVGTVSTRGDMVVCTLTEVVKDPATQYAAAIQQSGLSPDIAKMELLPSGNGYRFSGSMRMTDFMPKDAPISAEDRAGLSLIAGMIPRELTMSVTTTGTRVENTNGTVSPDGKSVTWKFPIHQIFDTRPEAEPIKFAADVYFK